MNSTIKKAALTAALTVACLSANAAQVDIRVWADIDNTLTLLKADGSPLPDAVKLDYNPARGLISWNERVRVFSNDITKDVQVRLQSPAELRPTTAPGGVAIPLIVSLGGKPLSTTAVDMVASELYPGGVPGGSVAMDLHIAQAKQEAVKAAGGYEGLVSVVLNAKP